MDNGPPKKSLYGGKDRNVDALVVIRKNKIIYVRSPVYLSFIFDGTPNSGLSIPPWMEPDRTCNTLL